jgi:integrase
VATIDLKHGQIRERRKGIPEFSYYVPKTSIAFMKDCFKAHSMIILLLGKNVIPKEELKTLVLKYAILDPYGKTELIKRIALKEFEPKTNETTLASIVDAWFEQKRIENPSIKQESILKHHKITIVKFFNAFGMNTTKDLNYDTAHKYIKWRSETNFSIYSKNTPSASTIKHELQTLRQMARIANRNGYLNNGNMWDDVKVKAIAGINKKIVEPLDVETQMNLLNKLKDTPHHDIALMLLITGIRIGELENLGKDSIKNGVLVLNGQGIGNFKPSTGKTASASRTLPVCHTLAELFNRGNIFKTNRNAFRLALNRNFKGVHPHRLRHSFAVNKLLAQVPLQMVSYQMGHSKTDITANLYGKFVPEHFKAGFEETIRIRKEHVFWLENKYF